MSESMLDKFLKSHRRTCTYWIFSGDRHCSCGRDAAIMELEELRAARAIELQLPLFYVQRSEFVMGAKA